MTTDHIYTLVNSVAAQSTGHSGIVATDTSSLVALGNTVLSSSTNTEAFINTLLQRIGRTIIDFRRYRNKLSDMVLNDFEYGMILQKVKVVMPEAVDDPTYDLVDGSSIDPWTVYKPTAVQKLFVKRTPYMFAQTISRQALKEAFTSADAMGQFIAAVMGEMRNAVQRLVDPADSIRQEILIKKRGRCRKGSSHTVPFRNEVDLACSLSNHIADRKTAEVFQRQLDGIPHLSHDCSDKLAHSIRGGKCFLKCLS